MAKQVDSTNIGTLLEALITKVKSFFWRKEETDNTPTSGSDNLVKSGGVFSALSNKYTKPENGIPASDLAQGVIPPEEVFTAVYEETTQEEVLAAVADGKVVVCFLNGRTYVYAGLSTAGYCQFTSFLYDTAFRLYLKNSTWGYGSYEVYSKPNGGIPATDLAKGVIPDVSQFITKSVNDLVNYYLKSEVYTKEEVADLIGAIQQFHYEIAASTSAVTNPSNNVLYLIGPTGTGSDKYEEYVYSGGWVKIGDTSIDLSGYVTTQALNTALAGYVTSEALQTALAGKQDKIDASHKLDYSLLENTPTIPAAQVPADWDATAGVSRILNKPTIPTQYAGSPTAGGFANKAVAIPFGNVDSDSTDTDIKATVDNFPATLTDGVCAFIRNNVVASASGFTLNINGTGAKPVYQTLADASRVSTIFNANSTYFFVYNSTRVEGGCWDLYYGYNSNDNTVGYNLRTNGASAPPAAQKYYRYRLLFTAANGLSLVPANTSSSTSATTAKTVNQTKIDPFGVIFYYSYTSAVNAAASPSAAYLWMQYNGVALGYSFNRTGEALEMTARDPVYLKCAPQSDGSAIIDADNPIVQALPTTADGNIYIFLGFAESATAITLYYWHPVYYHDGTSVRLWTGIGIDSTPTQNSKNLVTSGGIYDAIQNAGGGGGGTKTLKMKGTASFYFDGADVRSVKNDTLFYVTLEALETLFGNGYIYGTALFVTGSGSVSFFEIRSYNETEMNSEIMKFSLQSSTGNVLSIEFYGMTFTYNSATDRYEAQTS